MALDLSGVCDDMNDVVVTMQIPARKHSCLSERWADASVVLVPSDSENEDDDIAVISEIPTVIDLDNDDCILESYQPAKSSDGAVALITVKPVTTSIETAGIVVDQDILRTEVRGDGLNGDSFANFNPGLVLTSPPTDVGLLLFTSRSDMSDKRQDIFSECESFMESSVVTVGAQSRSQSSSKFCLNSALPTQTSRSSRLSVDGSLNFDGSGLMFNVAGKVSLIPEKNLYPDTSAQFSDLAQLSVGPVLSDDHSFALGSAKSSGHACLHASLPATMSLTPSYDMHTVDASSLTTNTKKLHSFSPEVLLSDTHSNSISHSSADDDAQMNSDNSSFVSISDVFPNTKWARKSAASHRVENTDGAIIDKGSYTKKILHRYHAKLSPSRRAYVSPMNRRVGSRSRIEPMGLLSATKKLCGSGLQSATYTVPPRSSGSESMSARDDGTKQVQASSCPHSSYTNVLDSSLQTLTSMSTASCFDDLNGDSLQHMSRCCRCRKLLGNTSLSYCMAGHSTCGDCLQQHVKTLLASGMKGSVKCLKEECSYFYVTSQLSNSLPRMVVEILEEKFNREYCDDVSRMLADEQSKRNADAATNRSSVDVEEGLLEIPKNWERMGDDEPYRKVEVVKGCDEFNWVSGQFHQTMDWQRSSITRVYRVQNHVLWQFFIVRRRQMARDNGGSEPLLEKHLFHGTSRRTVDAICLNNFDWRLCGSHGTMYGQGSYFAKDAAYSHMYTDPPPGHGCRHPGIRGGSAQFVVHAHAPYYRRSLLRAGSFVNRLMRSVHGSKPPLVMPSMAMPSALGVPLPAHQPMGPDMAALSRLLSSFLQPAHQQRAVMPTTYNQAGPSTAAADQKAVNDTLVVGGPSLAIQSHGAGPVSTFHAVCSDGSKSVPVAGGGHHVPVYLQSSRLPNAVMAHSLHTDPSGGGASSSTRYSALLNAAHSVFNSIPPPPLATPPSYLPLPAHPPHGATIMGMPVGHSPSGNWVPSSSWSAEPDSSPPAPSQHVMFLARVLVGRSTVGCSEFRKPPPIDPSRPYDKCYDTCVNRAINPSIFVVFNSSQCYPEYVIEYTNKAQSNDCA